MLESYTTFKKLCVKNHDRIVFDFAHHGRNGQELNIIIVDKKTGVVYSESVFLETLFELQDMLVFLRGLNIKSYKNKYDNLLDIIINL